MKFVSGDLVRNVTTNEDGRVIEAYEENGMAIYMASVPINVCDRHHKPLRIKRDGNLLSHIQALSVI